MPQRVSSMDFNLPAPGLYCIIACRIAELSGGISWCSTSPPCTLLMHKDEQASQAGDGPSVTGQQITFVHPTKGAPPQQFAQFQAAYCGALPLPEDLGQAVQGAAIASLVAVACSATLREGDSPDLLSCP